MVHTYIRKDGKEKYLKRTESQADIYKQHSIQFREGGRKGEREEREREREREREGGREGGREREREREGEKERRRERERQRERERERETRERKIAIRVHSTCSVHPFMWRDPEYANFNTFRNGSTGTSCNGISSMLASRRSPNNIRSKYSD